MRHLKSYNESRHEEETDTLNEISHDLRDDGYFVSISMPAAPEVHGDYIEVTVCQSDSVYIKVRRLDAPGRSHQIEFSKIKASLRHMDNYMKSEGFTSKVLSYISYKKETTFSGGKWISLDPTPFQGPSGLVLPDSTSIWTHPLLINPKSIGYRITFTKKNDKELDDKRSKIESMFSDKTRN
jgi:hypothetical protein